ncbi:MAG: HD domain-containing protein [Campylobacterota bacterium]|nr:HD domain-containing protein [Campylobacterota bacterium]
MKAFTHSIVFKSLVFFIFFGLVLLSTTITTFLLSSKDSIEKNVLHSLILTGESIVNELETSKTNIELTVLALARASQSFEHNHTRNSNLVRDILSISQFDAIEGGGIWPNNTLDSKNNKDAIFFAKDGSEVLHVNSDYNRVNAINYLHEQWFAPLIFFNEGEILWSKSYRDPYTKIPMITVSTPLFKDNKFSTVATIDVNTKYIDRVMRKYADRIEGYAFLLDRDNQIISHKKRDSFKNLDDFISKYPELFPIKEAVNRLKNTPTDDTLTKEIMRTSPKLTLKEAQSINSILQTIRHSTDTSTLYNSFSIDEDPFLQQKSFGIIYTTPDTQWKIGLITPYDKAFASSQEILGHLTLASIFTALMLTFFGYLGIRKLIVKPITDISDQMRQNKNVHLSELQVIHSEDKGELGTLVTTLNRRTQALKERYHEVKSLQQEIEETQKEVVFTMGAIGESRSKETGNHVKRVAEYSKLLAKYYGLDDKECEMLKQASPMHDIGKVAIPDAVLNKPGRFNEAERKIMDTHAALGYEMLEYSDRPLLKMAATVAYEHHEKWDGSGYPQGTSGENIHIYGRITALADVFDALGSDRVYKKAWDDERIFSLFREERGKHFDPKLIDIFFDNLDEFLKIRDQFKDKVE